jgi:hypothetical protein
MLVIDVCHINFFYFFNFLKKNRVLRLAQCDARRNQQNQMHLWKLTFSNGVTKIVKLSEGGYRSRWWLILNFQTLDAKQSYSIVISRFIYPKVIFQSLSAYLWSYV